ncbi:thiamine phosphate synthase [Bartonella rattaustraliani]|uniref:thiamine phosphate synthase n=1 Tax=Bartonella rattaustraliani TaxID=481139 RepID=UPI000305EF64|nr:thiamine phosphate synthase [Bartonella rattaustraliani]
MTKQQSKPIPSHSFPQLVLTLDARRNLQPSFLHKILQTKSFVCVILYDSQGLKDDGIFLQQQAKIYAEDIQHHEAALVIAADNRIAERVKADGVHIEGDLKSLEHFDTQKRAQKIRGFGNLRNRHCAMLAGEADVDYLLFGKLGADKKPHAHPRNLQLAQWWAEVMEIPAIVQAGSDFANFDAVVQSACEFIAVEEIIFAHDNPLTLLEMMKKKCESS